MDVLVGVLVGEIVDTFIMDESVLGETQDPPPTPQLVIFTILLSEVICRNFYRIVRVFLCLISVVDIGRSPVLAV